LSFRKNDLDGNGKLDDFGWKTGDRLKNDALTGKSVATLLPIDAAQQLREDLINYAADTKDHTVSDTFVQLMRSRKAISVIQKTE
jgi:hypothetical protein